MTTRSSLTGREQKLALLQQAWELAFNAGLYARAAQIDRQIEALKAKP